MARRRSSVGLRAFPRIHIALIDLGGATSRAFGGAGFALSAPGLELRATPARSVEVSARSGLDARASREVVNAATRLREEYSVGGVRFSFTSSIPQHVGLGSKTTIVLAALEAMSRLYRLSIPTTTLQRLSMRGGASGIGIHAFFRGGFLVDAGHDPSTLEGFVPSSHRVPASIPPLVARCGFPSAWDVHLVLPRGRRASGAAEKSFFESSTPLPRTQVLSVLGAIYHGVLPAFATEDLPLLRSSLEQVGATGFKAREIANQKEPVIAAYRLLQEIPEVAVGMSSMGPLLYLVAMRTGRERVARMIAAVCKESRSSYLGAFRGRNSGFRVNA